MGEATPSLRDTSRGASPHRVLVTGAGGQLAAAIVDAFAGSAEVRARSRRELDIADRAAVEREVAAFAPHAIVNCAAYNHVDRAEEDPAAALEANAFGVRVLAQAAASVGATLVHYSTDFVFDGEASQPYTEDDRPNPQSVYAASKLLGEWFARDAPRAFVLRVESLFGGRAARSSIDRIVEAVLAGREARAFVDRTVSPSYVVDVAEATRALLARGEPGLYHCVCDGFATWHEVALEIARRLGRDARIVPVSVRDVRLPARRPQFAALSNRKLARAGVAMPRWQDSIAKYVSTRGLCDAPPS
jgi:dTDP-4-dehydrorhamnose reductase